MSKFPFLVDCAGSPNSVTLAPTQAFGETMASVLSSYPIPAGGKATGELRIEDGELLGAIYTGSTRDAQGNEVAIEIELSAKSIDGVYTDGSTRVKATPATIPVRGTFEPSDGFKAYLGQGD